MGECRQDVTCLPGAPSERRCTVIAQEAAMEHGEVLLDMMVGFASFSPLWWK